jgi:hypothetical protein
MSDAPPLLAPITRPSIPTKATEQSQSSEEVLDGEITGEEAMVQCSKACDAEDTDVDMDLGEGTSNAASDGPPGSDPTSSADKSKLKSAFVKIMELKEGEMLTAYLQAFFGEPYDIWTRVSVLPVGSPR